MNAPRKSRRRGPALAFLLLRLTLGLNICMHGVSRIAAGPATFADSLVPMFQNTAAARLERPCIRTRSPLGRSDSGFSPSYRVLHVGGSARRLTAHPGPYVRHHLASGLEHRWCSASLCRHLRCATGARSLERLFPGPAVVAEASVNAFLWQVGRGLALPFPAPFAFRGTTVNAAGLAVPTISIKSCL